MQINTNKTKHIVINQQKNQNTKSQHNTRGSQFVTRRSNTAKHQNSCLKSALRMKWNGYKNKYTNPRWTEASTVAIQTIKNRKTRENKPKRLVSKSIQVKTRAVNSDMVECEKCGLIFCLLFNWIEPTWNCFCFAGCWHYSCINSTSFLHLKTKIERH